MNQQEQIAYNSSVHDKVAAKYKHIHPEIFNLTEQKRLKDSLSEAIALIPSSSNQPCALDVGCGSGNLTNHLRELNLAVTAADVSPKFLVDIPNNFPGVDTHLLNGVDLKEIPDQSFDLVVTYSVLHHIPDYLRMIEEMSRVLRPGGVMYIDHERTEAFWDKSSELIEFYELQRFNFIPSKIKKLCTPMWYVHRWRRFKNPKYQAEGDIHVWPDDHIQWEEIIQRAKAGGVEVVAEKNYLSFDERYNTQIFKEYESKVADMKVLVLQKSYEV
jgi:ubiquinone/menaquinone biosynthesis C-methylase UbiE